MKTRQSSLRELNQKLTTTLHELETSKTLNKRLLQEREESELEIQEIVQRNRLLKKELIRTEKELVELREQRNQLLAVVECHGQCDRLLDTAFEQIKELQLQLLESKHTIDTMHDISNQRELTDTAILYKKLIKPNDIEPSATIDLTSFYGDDKANEVYTQSLDKRRIKRRKYLKLKRLLLRRTRKIFQQKKLKDMVLGLIKERRKLTEEVNNYESSIEDYENDYLDNLEKILGLEADLEIIQSKYILAQREIQSCIATIDDLLGASSYNLHQLVESTEAKQSSDKETNSSQEGNQLPSPPPASSLPPVSAEENRSLSNPCNTERPPQSNNTKYTKVFCDDIGKSMGYILSTNVVGPIINNCMPNISYTQLINNVVNEKHTKDEDIVIMMGDSSGITRTQLINSIKLLLNLHESGTVNKIVVCTLPYSGSLSPEKNKKIYALNLILYNVIATNCNTGKVLLFDINHYIHNFVLTSNHNFLPKREKIVIAQLLTYVLQSESPTCNYGMIVIKPLN